MVSYHVYMCVKVVFVSAAVFKVEHFCSPHLLPYLVFLIISDSPLRLHDAVKK